MSKPASSHRAPATTTRAAHAGPAARAGQGGRHAASRKVRVAVVFGGRSGEHTISCATAAGVLSAIDRTCFEVLPIGISLEGRWLLVDDDPAALALNPGRPPVTVTEEGLGRGELAMRLGGGAFTVLGEAGPQVLGEVDVVLPLLHGAYGEDGTIQGMLEMLGLPYVGCGVLASAAGMDKQVTKVLLQAAGIATARHVVVRPGQWASPEGRAQVLAECQELGWPVFVKPARAGSSLGITKVEDASGLEAAIEAASAVDPKVLIEAAVVGREVEVAVLGGRPGVAGADGADGSPRVAEPGEIVMSAEGGAGEFYDYATKYLEHDAVQMVCPAAVTPAEREELMRTAAAAFTALEGEGLMRVDFFLTPDSRVIVNEVNTMPGFTPYSMYPYMWQTTGMDYTSLVGELIDLALSRRQGVNR